MNLNEVAQCLREYADALRGDWGSIDGRSEKASLNDLADAILAPESKTVTRLREDLGVCARGDGHWLDYCDEDCEAAA